MKVKSESEVAQSCPTLRDPMNCSLPGSSVHGIFQARVLEWGTVAFSVRLISKIVPFIKFGFSDYWIISFSWTTWFSHRHRHTYTHKLVTLSNTYILNFVSLINLVSVFTVWDVGRGRCMFLRLKHIQWEGDLLLEKKNAKQQQKIGSGSWKALLLVRCQNLMLYWPFRNISLNIGHRLGPVCEISVPCLISLFYSALDSQKERLMLTVRHLWD